MRVADYIINRIFDQGSDTIFSVSGRGALFLTDAVAKHGKIKNVAVHHEQAASFAAVAYAQASGRLGACLVSTGCASTNTMTGLLSAWQDNIPCIFISGQNVLNETSNFTGIKIRTYGQQEADIIPMVKSITKYSKMLHHANDIIEELDKAIYFALEGRQGPVWLDIPLDLQSANISFDESNMKLDYSRSNPEINDSDVEKVLSKLIEAKRPVVLIGSGVKSAKAEKELVEFIVKNNIPLVYSNSAPDTFGTKNDLSIGSIGSMGASRAGNFTIQNSDFLLILGNRLSSYSTGVDLCDFARMAHKIVVDIDPDEHKKKSIHIDHFIHADVRDFLTKLNNQKIELNNQDWLEKCKHWKTLFGQLEPQFKDSPDIDLYELTNVLSDVLPDNANVVTDSGFIEVIIPTNFKFGKEQKAIHPFSQGAMGFALPGALGAYYATNNPTFVVVGDGSIMMNLQELQTISHNKVPIKIIVINNNVYGIIRRRQVELFRGRTIGTDPNNGVSCPSFEKIANAFDFDYIKIEGKSQLNEKIIQLSQMEGPVICEIMCREDQTYLEVGIVRDVNRKMVRRPLEDQMPFIDRSLFLNEMVIKPIKQ